MTTKQRIQLLEKHTPKQEADAPSYQCILGEVVKVAWQSGRVTIEAEPLAGIKTYEGIDITTIWNDDNDNEKQNKAT
jgi:hypothetical protein